MSKWTMKKIEKQIEFGDFVEFELSGKKVKRIVVSISGTSFSTIGDGQKGASEWDNSDLMERSYKFFDRQGKEVLPEPEYKYVNFDSFGELCEAIVNGGDIYNSIGVKILFALEIRTLGDINHWNDTFFKRVEV